MTSKLIQDRLPRVLPKALLLDLEDRLRAEAVKANEMVRDHAGLDTRRARELVGQARFRMWEKGFEEVCILHGGKLLDGGVLPKSDLKIFQPYMRFESEGEGIILGLANMPEPRALPHKNKSRLAGVTLNFYLTPRLDLDGTGPKIGDIFVLFLGSRDRHSAGQMEEIAVGVVNSKYDAFLFYEKLDKFLSRYAARPAEAPTSASPTPLPPVVALKKNVTPFVPPETPKPDKKDKKSESK